MHELDACTYDGANRKAEGINGLICETIPLFGYKHDHTLFIIDYC